VVEGTLDDIVARVGARDFFNLNSPDRRHDQEVDQ
jgi:hypothetical protein